jgi:hypothetical protein
MTWRAMSAGVALGAALSLASATARAETDDARSGPYTAPAGSDGVYGRFDANLTLDVAAGAELEAGEPRAALKLSADYLSTAGVYGRYSDAFGTAEARPSRVASCGVQLQPLFLPRFAVDLERGPALLDLALDSLSLSAGAYFAQPDGRGFGDERGFETGLGFGLPLAARAQGLWLEARAERRFADRGDNAWLFTLSLAYHALAWSTEARR